MQNVGRDDAMPHPARISGITGEKNAKGYSKQQEGFGKRGSSEESHKLLQKQTPKTKL